MEGRADPSRGPPRPVHRGAVTVPRWRARRPEVAVEPVALLEADPDWDTPEARRTHWGALAMDLLRDNPEVPTSTVLDAYLGRVLA